MSKLNFAAHRREQIEKWTSGLIIDGYAYRMAESYASLQFVLHKSEQIENEFLFSTIRFAQGREQIEKWKIESWNLRFCFAGTLE